jgi:hypothetical protein
MFVVPHNGRRAICVPNHLLSAGQQGPRFTRFIATATCHSSHHSTSPCLPLSLHTILMIWNGLADMYRYGLGTMGQPLGKSGPQWAQRHGHQLHHQSVETRRTWSTGPTQWAVTRSAFKPRSPSATCYHIVRSERAEGGHWSASRSATHLGSVGPIGHYIFPTE